MDYGGLRGVSWTTADYCGLPRITQTTTDHADYHGSRRLLWIMWIVMDYVECRGVVWSMMEYNGEPWSTMEYAEYHGVCEVLGVSRSGGECCGVLLSTL